MTLTHEEIESLRIAIARKKKPPAERFWKFVKKTSSCWIWTGGVKGHGYGSFFKDGKQLAAHRFSWEIANGPIPSGMCVCHKCDNPICCNPDHLFIGTQSDNLLDAASKNRNPMQVRPDKSHVHVINQKRRMKPLNETNPPRV